MSIYISSLILRTSLGILFIAHGLLKVCVFTIPGTVAFFASLGYPPLIAYLTMTAELVCGSFILIGFYSRIAAIFTIPVLIGATMTHFPNGWFFTSQNGGYEFPLFWLVVLFSFISLGNRSSAIRLSILDKIASKLPFGKFLLDR